jgi:hypothetical protein
MILVDVMWSVRRGEAQTGGKSYTRKKKKTNRSLILSPSRLGAEYEAPSLVSAKGGHSRLPHGRFPHSILLKDPVYRK